MSLCRKFQLREHNTTLFVSLYVISLLSFSVYFYLLSSIDFIFCSLSLFIVRCGNAVILCNCERTCACSFVRNTSIVCSLISKGKHSLAKWIMKIKQQITFWHSHGLPDGEKDRTERDFFFLSEGLNGGVKI